MNKVKAVDYFGQYYLSAIDLENDNISLAIELQSIANEEGVIICELQEFIDSSRERMKPLWK